MADPNDQVPNDHATLRSLGRTPIGRRRGLSAERDPDRSPIPVLDLGREVGRLLVSPERGSGGRPPATIDESERVKVTVRLRPPPVTEGGQDDCGGAPFIFLDTEKNTVILRRRGSFTDFTEFKFDAVMPQSCHQVDVFNVAAKAVVMDVLEGYNGTIMAYGQTGAGKTYTLFDSHRGNYGEANFNVKSDEGIIPRSAAEIFERAKHDQDHEYHVSMSYIQIYMEQIQDLLRPESANMQIREGESGVYVSGVEEVQVKSVDECMKLLMLGDRNRNFAFTKLNAHSSRSHAIAMITVEKKANYSEQKKMTDRRRRSSSLAVLESEKILVGKLYLVDLAGSERLKKSGSEGIRASEAMSVNLSLTVLGKCISARADPSKTHVPFRDSKLTRLLQESLGGNAKTSLIINLAPSSAHLQESLSSLHFGSRAMKVSTRAIVNVEEEFRVITRNLQEALNLQDERLQSLEAQVMCKDEELLEARKNLEYQTQQVEKLKGLRSHTFHGHHDDDLADLDSPDDVKSPATQSLRKRIGVLQDEIKKLKCMRGGPDVVNTTLARDFAARVIQRAYRRRFAYHMQEERTKIQEIASYQLMANSATKVLKAMRGLDNYFTGLKSCGF